jgi:hypothetical protein
MMVMFSSYQPPLSGTPSHESSAAVAPPEHTLITAAARSAGFVHRVSSSGS